MNKQAAKKDGGKHKSSVGGICNIAHIGIRSRWQHRPGGRWDKVAASSGNDSGWMISSYGSIGSGKQQSFMEKKGNRKAGETKGVSASSMAANNGSQAVS